VRVGITHGVSPVIPQKRSFSANSGPSVRLAPAAHVNDKRSTSEQPPQGSRVTFFFGEALAKQTISGENNQENQPLQYDSGVRLLFQTPDQSKSQITDKQISGTTSRLPMQSSSQNSR